MRTLFPTRLVLAIATIISILSIAGCQKNIGLHDQVNAQSSVKLFLTDDPSIVFDQLWLDIQKIEIKVEDDTELKHESEHQHEVDDNDKGGDHSGGWIAVAINPGVYDILKFRNGLDTLFASANFPAVRQLRKLRITLGNKNSIVVNGVTTPLSLKGNDNIIVLKLEDHGVDIATGGLTNIWIDIDAARSVSRHGNEFELKPSVKLFSKDNTGRLEGRVLPQDATPIVMAVNGTDTATARPEREGEFKFTGLKPGTYSIIYHATSGNYIDTTLQHIALTAKEDTKLPDIILHK